MEKASTSGWATTRSSAGGLLGGRPFFFYRKGEHFGIAYDGRELPHRYEELPHDLCCEPAMLNPVMYAQGGALYGLRDGRWHYVMVGLSP